MSLLRTTCRVTACEALHAIDPKVCFWQVQHQAQLREDGFGDRPWFRTLIAECEAEAIGYAIWYITYNASFGTRVIFSARLSNSKSTLRSQETGREDQAHRADRGELA